MNRSSFACLTAAPLALFVLVAACSSDDSRAANGTPAPDAATDATPNDGGDATPGDATPDGSPVQSVASAPVCADLAAKLCGYLEKCQPKFIDVELADPKSCVAHFEASCNAGVPPGVGFRKDDADALAACLAGLTCEDNYGPRWSTACALPRLSNAKPLGGSCRRDNECESRGCTGSSTTCGKCAPVVAAGAACNDDNVCARSGFCTGGTCRAVAYLGETCDANNVCGNGLVCNAGKCAKNGGVVGTSCTEDSQCDLAQLIACNETSGKCELLTLVDVGGACERFGNGPPQTCRAGGYCAQPQQGTPGECTAGKKVGEACSSSSECEGLINCREGKCVLPTYTACP